MLSAIIPTLTNNKGLFKLINHLIKIKKIEIIVIDNQPDVIKKNKLSSFLSTLVSDSHLLYLPQSKNLGFAKAVNLGAKIASGEWLWILNDDIEIPILNSKIKIQNENLNLRILNLLKYAKKNHLDAVSPVLVKTNGEVENYGYQILPIGRVQLINNPSPIINNEIDGLTAACLFIKRKVFKKVGGFDERFFAYLEDVDLFLRLKKHGFKFGVDPNSFAIHNHMTTSSKMGYFKEKQDLVNWIRIILKNWGVKNILYHFPEIILERGRNLSGLIKKIIKVHFS
jgi:GT2 family glycosyltransferase